MRVPAGCGPRALQDSARLGEDLPGQADGCVRAVAEPTFAVETPGPRRAVVGHGRRVIRPGGDRDDARHARDLLRRDHDEIMQLAPVLSPHEVVQRTWERGSGETLACGTGASAVCVAGVLTGRTERSIVNHLRGGDLMLQWNAADNHVYMTGPAEEVFSGEWPG